MKRSFCILALVFAISSVAGSPTPDFDPKRIDIYVTPYYAATGPSVNVGEFSEGLAAKNEAQFLSTIRKMKENWDRLSFVQLYVAAIRLYDFGYRNESVYWYYTAQYRGRQFGLLLDQSKMGGLGAPGFELLQAQGAFFQLAGPYISGYAYGDISSLIKVVERVRAEGEKMLDLQTIYRGVVFKDQRDWAPVNSDLANGMDKLVQMMTDKREEITKKRIAIGLEAKFSRLSNKELANQSSEPTLSSGTPPAGQEPRPR